MNEELKVIISAEVKKLKDGVEDAKKKISSFKDEVKSASENVDADIKKMGEGIGNGLKTAAGITAGAVTAVGAAFISLGPATEEYRTAQAKLNTAFEAAGSDAGTAKEVYNDLYRVLGDGDVAVEAAAHLAKLTTSEQDLSEWTNICQGVYATFGDSLPIEGLTEAVNHTAKLGEVQGPLADALEWAGVSADSFNTRLAACTDEAEREKLIRQVLSGLYNDAAADYEKNAAATLEQNEAQAKLQETMAELGAVVAPVITAFTSLATDALSAVVPYIQELAEKYMPDLKEILSGVVDALGSALDFVIQHKELLAVIGGVIAGVVTAIGLYNAVAAVKAAMNAAEVTTLGALVAAQLAHAAAAMVALAPYLLIVAAIAAVIAIIVLCVKHWDEIKEAVSNAMEKIKEVVSKVVDAVVGFFKNMVDGIKNKANEIKTAVSEKFNAVKEKISGAMEGAKNAVKEKLNNIKDAYNENGGGLKGIAAATMETIKSKYQLGYDAINKLTGGKLGEVVDKMRSKMQNAKEAISNALGNIKEKFVNIFENVKNTVRNAIDKLKSFFKFDWNLPKLKLPKISITGKFSLSPLQVPKFSIKWNALGGVFDKPAIFGYGNTLQGIGENGAEAVVPLENNLAWLDKLAGMLNDRMGGGKNIVLQVDGKAFAQISCDSINQLTRQRGSIPLNLI